MNAHPTPPTAIRLLILSSSRDQTQRFTTSLRNGGLAVHPTRLSDLSDLVRRLRSGEYDLVLCCAYDPAIKLGRTLEAVNDAERDTPLLIMTDDSADPDVLLQAMREGARDLVDKNDLEHLQLVILREFHALQQRRRVHELERRLEESNQRCMTLIESSSDAIAFIQDGIHVRVNPAYLRLFGVDERADLEDLPLLNLIDKGSHKALKAALRKVESTDTDSSPIAVDMVFQRQDGTTLKGELTLARGYIEGEPSIQAIARTHVAPQTMVTPSPPGEPHEANEPSTTATENDPRLVSRQRLLAELENWMARAAEENRQCAVLYIAIDDSDKLRSALGLVRFVQLMTQLAQALILLLEQDELMCQFGDNVFIALCRRSDTESIRQVAEQLCQLTQQTRFAGLDPNTGPRCSIGITLLAGQGAEALDLVNDAHNASEAVRERGGNGLLVSETDGTPVPEIDAHDARILEQIDTALANQRFRLLYQPIVSLQGDTRENYAVLVRLLDEQDNELLPEMFIKQAEQYGRMAAIDRWVIRHAIENLSIQRKEGRKVTFFVNLSEQGVLDKDMLIWICDCLREFDARGGWLAFQIREICARDQLRVVAKLVDGLKKIKCQIAIDHFGLLPKPEVLFNHLTIDYAKLAPSFLREISNNQQKQDELNSLNELIISQNAKTIATEVEDANSLTVLWTVGVGYIQGYFLQEPSESIEYGSQQVV